MASETVASAVAEELAGCGVDRVFGVPGGEVLLLIDALRKHGIEYALCRHEADAGITAAVYGKLRGVAGVVLTTLGPGAANLMLPLANSLLDREPLLAISAQTPQSWSPYRTHQKLPLLETYAPVTKVSGTLGPENCRSLLRAAVSAAVAEPKGPAFLTLTADDAQAPHVRREKSRAVESRDVATDRRTGAKAAEELRQRLGASEQPLVVVGLGTRPATAGALRDWLGRWQLPVAVTPKAKGIVDETKERFVGVVGGMAIDAMVRETLARADLVVGFGLDPVEIDGAWHLELPVVWTLESEWATGILPARDLVLADHLQLLEAMGRPPRAWSDDFADLRRTRREIFDGGRSRAGISPIGVVRALASVMPAETIVTTDVGSHKYVFGQFWPSRRPETFFMSNGLSGMGYGIPAAIGAKLARPDSPVIAVVGDGGFAMNGQELETARRLGAPFVTVVLVDNSYSLIRIGQENRGLERYGVDFAHIDAVRVAQACGIEGIRTDDEQELAERAASTLESGKPLLVEVPIDANDYRKVI